MVKAPRLTLSTHVHLPPMYWQWLEDRANEHACATIHDVVRRLIEDADARKARRVRVKAGSMPIALRFVTTTVGSAV